MASFQFGATNPPTTQPTSSGFTLSQTQQQQHQQQQQQAKGFSYVVPASTGGFNFGPSATTPSTGFAFGAPATTSAATGLSFGTPANASAAPGGFSFGTPAVTPSGGFSFGQPATTASSSTGFGFGQPAPATTTGSGFMFGAPNTSVGSSSTGFNFSNPGSTAAATTAGMGFSFSTQPASSTFSGFGVPATTAGSSNTFGFGAVSSANTTGSGFSLVNTQPSSASSAFNFSTPKTTTPVIAPGFGFGVSSTPAATTTVASNTTGSLPFGTAAPSSFGATQFAFGPKPAAAATAPATGFAFAPPVTTSSIFTPGQMSSTSILNPPVPFNQGTTTTATVTTPSALGANLVSVSTAPSGFAVNTTSVPSFSGATQSSGVPPVGFMTTETPKTAATAAAFNFPLATSSVSSAASSGFGAPVITTSNTAVIKPTLSFTVPTTSVASVAPVLPTSIQADQAKVPSLTTTAPTSISSSVSSGFCFPSSTTPATTSTLTTAFAAPVGPSLKVPATTSASSLLSTSSPFSSATSTFGSFGTTTSVSLSTATSVTASSAAGAALTTTTTVTPASAAPPATMNFRQLEDTINKWKIELEEQERVFLNQATQVNAWDRLLISNGEKITELNEAVERVKLDQQRLDHELDFILAQQRELEELLVPLEKSVESTPNIHHQQHADLEREHTYHLAENIDAQLKRMAEDIKEIIEHLNSSNKAQDDNDPIQQIAKILNAHMDALQWVDQNTAVLRRKLDETSKLYESHRRDHEKSFRVGFS